MNILFINPPIRLRRPAYFQPFGMAVMAQVLRNAGHHVEVYDINSTRYTEEEVIENLPQGKYDMIGTGGLITIYKYLLFLVPWLRKKYRNTLIVIGGAGLTSSPEVFMDNLRPDYGVIGEGEYTILELANGLDHQKIPGLTYYENGKLVINPPRLLERNLDNFPMQAFDLFDMDKYAMARGIHETKRELGVLATRGCPRSCAFCYHVFGRSQRYRSVDNVLDEIEYLVDRYGIGSVLLADELFTARKSYVVEFCEKIMKRRLGVEWTCQSRVDTVDEETMALMSWAGCFRIGFGIESGSQKILDEMGKGTTAEQALKAVQMARKYFRIVGTTFIFGMPGEDKETIKESIRWCEDAELLYREFYHLSPYPGTRVYEENLDKILAQHGSEHDFFKRLGDVKQFSANLTNWSDDAYFKNKYRMQSLMRLRNIKLWVAKVGGTIPSEFVDDGTIVLLHPQIMRARR